MDFFLVEYIGDMSDESLPMDWLENTTKSIIEHDKTRDAFRRLIVAIYHLDRRIDNRDDIHKWEKLRKDEKNIFVELTSCVAKFADKSIFLNCVDDEKFEVGQKLFETFVGKFNFLPAPSKEMTKRIQQIRVSKMSFLKKLLVLVYIGLPFTKQQMVILYENGIPRPFRLVFY
jgi:hypothetical protein